MAISDVQNASRPSQLPTLSAANVACTLGRLMKDRLEPMGKETGGGWRSSLTFRY